MPKIRRSIASGYRSIRFHGTMVFMDTTEGPRGRFVCVAKVGDPTTAQILAARLESEGIEARVHGEALGPYRLTVGEMAVSEVWVTEDRLDEARTVVLDSEVSAALAPAETDDIPDWPIEARVLAIVVAVFMVAVIAWRAMRIF
jgi:hypothetical protein